MKAKRSNRLDSDLNETGIFLFLTLVIFFGAVGFPTLINTSPTIGYDDDTIAKLTPVTSYYQQAFAEQEAFGILSNYYFDPNITSAYMILPTMVDLPPPDMVSYFIMKYGQGIEVDFGFIPFETIEELFSPDNILPPVYALTFSQNETDVVIAVDSVTAQIAVSIPEPITDLNATQINSILLEWTEPDDGGSPITGYEIQRARTDISRNGTYLDFLIREGELSGDSEPSTSPDGEIVSASEGFIGQAVNVTADAEVEAVSVSLHRNTSTSCSGSAFLQGGVFFKNGTRIANSTNTFSVCTVDTDNNDEDNIFLFNITEIFSGNEYVFGVEKVGTNTDGDIDVVTIDTTNRNATAGNTVRALSSPPFTFTNSITEETAVSVYTLNFTTLVADTGNTNTNYTDNTCPEGITCYYRAQAINAIGTAGKSNIANATEAISTLFTTTTDVNPVWSFRTHDDTYGVGQGQGNGICDAGGNTILHCGFIPDTEFSIQNITSIGAGGEVWQKVPDIDAGFTTSGSAPQFRGGGYIFKTFTRDSVLNQNITVYWEQQGGGGNDRPMSIKVYDGAYIAENNEDFPYNLPIKEKGGGLLGTCTTQIIGSTKSIHFTECLDGIDGNDRLGTVDIDYSLSTEDYITVFVNQPANRLDHKQLILVNMTVSNLAFWDLTGVDAFATRGQLGNSTDGRIVEIDEEAGFFTNGTVVELNASAPDQVTGLVITQNMTNNALLDWDDISGADEYQVYRKDNFTGIINSTWEYREGNIAAGGTTPQCTFVSSSGSSGGVLIGQSGSDVNSDNCFLFKRFPTSFLNNTRVEVDWTGFFSVTGLDDGDSRIFYTNLEIIDRTVQNVFGSTTGTIGSTSKDILSPVLDKANDPSGWARTFDSYLPTTGEFQDKMGDEDDEFTYLVFSVEDVTEILDNPTTRIHTINITDVSTGIQKAFFNFSGAVKTSENVGLCKESGSPLYDCDYGLFDVTSFEVANQDFELIARPTVSELNDTTVHLATQYVYKVGSNNTSGYGLNSTEVQFGLIDPIDAYIDDAGNISGSLIATPLNSTAIELTWNKATTSHPTDQLTGILIQSNSTGSFQNVTTVDELVTSYIDNGLTTGIVYSYRLKAFSAVSNGAFGTSVNATVSLNATQSESDFVSIADETTLISPPFPITTLTGNTVTDTCQLSWSTPPNGGSAITSYNIYRSVDGGFYVFLASKVTTSHIDTGLANNVLYEYNVTALNAFGESESSNIVDCMPITTGVPSAPTTLEATEESNGDVTLTWLEPATGDPTGYRIERKIAPASFSTLVNDTGSPSLTYLDTTTNPSTEYTYRVAGWNSFGLGVYSNEEVITTASAPNAPILTAQQVGDVITVNWTQPASDNPINGYKIDRRINLGSFTTFIANTSSTDLSTTDSSVMKPNTYGYRVRALSSSGQGSVSNVVDVVFGSHVIVQVREQDGSGFKGGGIVKAFNSTFSEMVGLNANSNAIFDNFATGNYNYTFIDNSNFILNKTFDFPFPSGNLTSSFTANALVFDVDCPDNGVGTDVRIKLNYTDAKDITEYPSTPVCDSTDQVSWSTRWQGGAVNDTSIMVADFISTIFKANAEQFLASAEVVPTSYSGVNNAITSDAFQVNATDVTINFNLFLGRAPAGGGGGGSGSGSTTTSPPVITNPDVVIAQRLTGLSLLSRTHQFAQAGDIIEGSITVNWEGEENLEVKSITPTNTDIDIRFDQLPPFDLDQRIEGIGEFAMSTAEIPYSIILQPQECSQELGISQNCFEPVLHTLPLEFEFEKEGQVYEALTEVFVDGRPIPLDIVQLQIILLFLVLVASAVFGGFIRNRFKKKTRRSKKVKQKFKKKFDSS